MKKVFAPARPTTRRGTTRWASRVSPLLQPTACTRAYRPGPRPGGDPPGHRHKKTPTEVLLGRSHQPPGGRRLGGEPHRRAWPTRPTIRPVGRGAQGDSPGTAGIPARAPAARRGGRRTTTRRAWSARPRQGSRRARPADRRGRAIRSRAGGVARATAVGVDTREPPGSNRLRASTATCTAPPRGSRHARTLARPGLLLRQQR